MSLLSGGPVDVDARTRIRTDLDHNLFVEAGAGTGKTTVLVDRVVALVSSGRVAEPSRLVAITFTEAAAAELRDRIRESLERAAADPARPAAERARCDAAVSRIDDANITTLHGFAQRILADHPLEAGLPPSFDIDDDIAAGVRFTERWSVFGDELFADPAVESALSVGFTLGLTTARLREVAEEFHGRWDRLVEEAVDRPDRPDRPDETTLPPPAFGSVVDAVRELQRAAGPEGGDPDDRLAVKVRQWVALADRLDYEAAGDDDGLIRLATLATTEPPGFGGAGTQQHWGPRKVEIGALVDGAAAARSSVLAAQRHQVLCRLLPRLRAFTLAGAAQRRREGRLEFHDLLVLARNLLRADVGVRRAAAERIDVLLIDEFQDTDPLQLDIAFLLAAADPGAAFSRWEDTELGEGRLLIVGDPKQSIYAFRGADIALWDRARSRFGDRVVALEQNFRSVPSVIDWVNHVFDVLIGEGRPGSQPRYRALHPWRPDGDEKPTVVVVGEPIDALTTAIRQREATDLARLIATMKAQRWEVGDRDGGGRDACRALRYADIAILVPTRTPLGHIERALDGADIPYRVESRSLVWATDAVRDVLSVLAAVDDPADQVAVVAALRSPGFACPDDALLAWRVAGGSWDPRRPPPAGSVSEGPVAAAMAALHAYHRRRWWTPVNELIEAIIRERRLVELCFAQRRPRDHWRRLRFVVDQARAFVEAGGLSLGEFVAWARRQGDERAQVVETVVPEPDDDAVRILTVHGSKGLEFPVVILAGLNIGRRPDTTRVRWGDHQPEVRVGSLISGYFETSGWAPLAATANAAEDEESIRLLYVAATRARDHLVLSLHHKVGARSPARDLWDLCQRAEDRWRPADLPEQLTLAEESTASTPPVPVADGERQRWADRRASVLAATRRDRVFSATALAALGAPVADEVEPGGSEPQPDGFGAEGVGWPGMATRRRATAIGRAVHGVLRAVDLVEPTSAQVQALARLEAGTEGVAEAADEVAALALSALDAPALHQARAAGRAWREMYVAAPVGDGLVEGYIDLAYETGDGELVVVDYKTDRAGSVGGLDRAVARYRLQGAAYALALEVALGRPVARCVFVFSRPEGAVEREIHDLAAAVTEARALLGDLDARAVAVGASSRAERAHPLVAAAPYQSTPP